MCLRAVGIYYNVYNSCEFYREFLRDFPPPPHISTFVRECVQRVKKREKKKYFIKPAKSSAERVHSLHNPSVIRSSGVSVPRIAITTVCR